MSFWRGELLKVVAQLKEIKSQRADLRDWNGVDLTGANDIASIVQTAINATAAAGTKLNIPAGKITLGSKISVPAGANIEGPGLPIDRFNAKSAFNAYFHISHLGIGFELTGAGQPRRMAGFGTYRDQPAIGVGWAPATADYDINVKGVYDAAIENIFLYNATRGIQVIGDTVTPAGNGRITINNIRGQPLNTGLGLTHCYDVCYIDNVHFWPFWSGDANVYAYTKANAISFLFKRVDNPDIGRIFSYGYRIGTYFDQQASVGSDSTLPPGGPSLLHADVMGLDNCGETGLFVAPTLTNPTFVIDSLYAGGSTAMSESIVRVQSASAKGRIDSLYGYTTNKSLVEITGSGNDIKVGDSRSVSIDMDATGDAEFNVATGNTLTLMATPITSAGTVYGGAGTIRKLGTAAFKDTGTSGNTVPLLDAVNTWSGRQIVIHQSASVIANATGALGIVEIQAPNPPTSAAAFVAFRRPGAFAAYFGIDSDNYWKVGGWSMGANAYKLLHEGLDTASLTGSYGFSINPSIGPAINTAGNAQSIASGAEVALSNHSGLLVVNDTSTGQTALFICGGGLVALVAQTITEFAATSTPTTSQIGVYYSAPSYRVKNGFAAAKTIGMMWLAARNNV